MLCVKELSNVKQKFYKGFDVLDNEIFSVLLKDHTTRKNLRWATDSYSLFGLFSDDAIRLTDVGLVLRKPRMFKTASEQFMRSKKNAEVFTPAWVCNCQNNLVDSAWFGRENVFNIVLDKSWQPILEPISFPCSENKSWIDYIRSTRLEVSCGEAPYLTSRYDVVSAEFFEPSVRIGILDRKLRVVSENTEHESEWVEWAIVAVQNIYGYDWQGDNVLFARTNLLLSINDFFVDKFGKNLNKTNLISFAKVLSWNIWQMDGIKCVIPNSCRNYSRTIDTLFGPLTEKESCLGCAKKTVEGHNGIYCKIMDWEKHKAILFKDLMEK